jgi:LysR family glycine cleavage system transcriptional activator
MNDYKRKRRLPSLNALRAFEAAARHMSFKEAAEELSVSQSAVSHQVKGLEDALGVALFARRTRGVELTRKGAMYYPVLRSAFESIAEGTDMILEEQSVSVLTLHVYSTFTIRWLLPRLASFQESQENVQVRLHTSQSDVNFEQNDVDAAIMIGQPRDKALHYDYLFSSELSPVCCPAYLEKHGPLSQTTDLLNWDTSTPTRAYNWKATTWHSPALHRASVSHWDNSPISAGIYRPAPWLRSFQNTAYPIPTAGTWSVGKRKPSRKN